MSIASKKLKKQKKKTMSISTKTTRPQHCRSRRRRRRRTSYHSGHKRWETLLPHTPTQLRLARSLARTTRTRNETETDFLIGVNCVDYFTAISDIYWCEPVRNMHEAKWSRAKSDADNKRT